MPPAIPTSAPAGSRLWPVIGGILAITLLVLLLVHVAGVVQDVEAVIRSPLELDYGEGIVWEQAELIPGPRMYGPGQGLPFIVFHYPPLYHLMTRAFLLFEPDMLASGRLASGVSMLVIGLAIGGLVLAARPRTGPGPGTGIAWTDIWSAAIAVALVVSLHAIHEWALVMRVDTLAVALSLLGALVGARANGNLWGTTAALLLCVASVFTKQTELAAGVAVFLVALLRNPRSALAAAAIAGGVGVGVVLYLQWLTAGGFLLNIVGYNINRYALIHAYWVFWPERTSILVMVLVLVAAVALLLGPRQSASRSERRVSPRGVLLAWYARIRAGQPQDTARLLLLTYFLLANLMLFTVFKSGGNFNYLLDWLCVGTALLGTWIADVIRGGIRTPRQAAPLFALFVACLFLPGRLSPDTPPPGPLAMHDRLVRMIAAADKPVASENMTLLLQAGKHPVFEPSIVTELASVGRWDERPLVEMFATGAFAFVLDTDDTAGGTPRRTPAIDAAMRKSYPRVEQVGPRLWLRTPQP